MDELEDYSVASIGAFEVSRIIISAISFGYELYRNNVDLDGDISEEDQEVIGGFIGKCSEDIVKIVGDIVGGYWEKAFRDVGLEKLRGRRWWEVWKI